MPPIIGIGFFVDDPLEGAFLQVLPKTDIHGSWAERPTLVACCCLL